MTAEELPAPFHWSTARNRWHNGRTCSLVLGLYSALERPDVDDGLEAGWGSPYLTHTADGPRWHHWRRVGWVAKDPQGRWLWAEPDVGEWQGYRRRRSDALRELEGLAGYFARRSG